MSPQKNTPERRACLALIGPDESLLFADGYDAAILGVAELNGAPSVVYDASDIVEILCDRDGMTPLDAEGFFAFNIEAAYLGPSSPIFLHRAKQKLGTPIHPRQRSG